MTLSELHPGQQAIIAAFDTYMPPIKLLELGFLPGNAIELIQIAPLNDPMYFNVNGSHLAIRRAIAEQIIIQPLTEEPPNE